jgi:AcrR family transcriptional regulator
MTLRGRPVTLSETDLLDAARQVFLARGLDATTAEIAQRAHISESVIFHRYKTREALAIAVFERQIVLPAAFEKLASLVGKGEIADHMFQVGAGLIDLTKQLLPLMMMAFSSPTKLPHFHERVCKPHPIRLRMIRLLSGYFEAEVRKGRLRAIDPEILARAFLGAVQHYVMTEFIEQSADPLPLSSATFLRGAVNLLLEGANPKSEPRRGRR